jgi:hypothetical protein
VSNRKYPTICGTGLLKVALIYLCKGRIGFRVLNQSSYSRPEAKGESAMQDGKKTRLIEEEKSYR